MKAFYRLFYYISIVLTSILAGVTIAGAFVGNAAPDSFKFMLGCSGDSQTDH